METCSVNTKSDSNWFYVLTKKFFLLIYSILTEFQTNWKMTVWTSHIPSVTCVGTFMYQRHNTTDALCIKMTWSQLHIKHYSQPWKKKLFHTLCLLSSHVPHHTFPPFTWLLHPSIHLFPLPSSALELPGLSRQPPHLHLISALQILNRPIPFSQFVI